MERLAFQGRSQWCEWQEHWKSPRLMKLACLQEHTLINLYDSGIKFSYTDLNPPPFYNILLLDQFRQWHVYVYSLSFCTWLQKFLTIPEPRQVLKGLTCPQSVWYRPVFFNCLCSQVQSFSHLDETMRDELLLIGFDEIWQHEILNNKQKQLKTIKTHLWNNVNLIHLCNQNVLFPELFSVPLRS